jgi:hypothetical protein
MASKILYDIRDNSIIRCQAEPKGSAGLPSIGALYKSARVAEDDKQYMDSIVIDGDYLTKQAQEQFRIVNDEVKFKPKTNLSLNYNEIFAGETIILTVEITKVLDSDNFTSINMLINDLSFAIDIVDNIGTKEIQLDEADNYIIKCNDERFLSQLVKVEVV